MIECVSGRIWYKRKKLRIGSFFLAAIFFISFLFYYRLCITENLVKFSGEYINSCFTDSVNDAVLKSLDNKTNYNSLVEIEKDNSGNIVMINLNSYNANTISRNVVKITKQGLVERLKLGVPIPFWAFSGIEILSGLGKQVHFKSLSVLKVDCDFESKFTSVGINQTLHSVYLVIISQTTINLPLNKQKKVCESKILIAENVLIGKVPEVYIKGNSLK